MLIYFTFSFIWNLYYISGVNIVGNLMSFGLMYCGIYLISVLLTLYNKLVLFRNRDDIEIPYNVVFLYPFFSFYLFIVKVFAFVGFLLYYLPFHVEFKLYYCPRYNKHKLMNMVENNTINNITRTMTPLDIEQEVDCEHNYVIDLVVQ